MVTIFTSPKPFRGHIDVIQRNALESWLALGGEVEVLMIGDEEGMAEVAHDLGVRHLPQVARNAQGTPLLSSIFDLAHRQAHFEILCYVNADILLLDDFLPAVREVASRWQQYLIVGQRWDMDVTERLSFERGWREALRRRIAEAGRRHPPAGSDYFVFPRRMFSAIPPFALGRSGWDNWMVFAGRQQRVPVVDASQAITIVHQNHDYSHLPGGQPHFRLPESRENVTLGGGRETVFTLVDTTWKWEEGRLRRVGWQDTGLTRWVEAGLIARLGPRAAARAVRMAMHPVDTLTYYSRVVRRRLRRLLHKPGETRR
jgi:hypothetical protein